MAGALDCRAGVGDQVPSSHVSSSSQKCQIILGLIYLTHNQSLKPPELSLFFFVTSRRLALTISFDILSNNKFKDTHKIFLFRSSYDSIYLQAFTLCE